MYIYIYAYGVYVAVECIVALLMHQMHCYAPNMVKYIYICVYIYVCIHTYIYMYTYIYICIHIYIYVYDVHICKQK